MKSYNHPVGALADEIAAALNDYDCIMLYRFYCDKYPESLIWTVLEEVKATPIQNIKKSRAALFNYLIRKYVQNIPYHSRNQSGS